MPGINQATILGNVGKDPEIKRLGNGAKVANFSIATSETWRDKSTGEQREKTEWHKIVVWAHGDSDGLVGVVEKYVSKGSKVFVQGSLETRKWQDKDGSDRYSTEIVLKGFNAKLELAGGNSGGGGDKSESKSSASASGNSNQTMAEAMDDEIPF